MMNATEKTVKRLLHCGLIHVITRNLTSTVLEVDARLLNVRPPHFLNRIPRSVKDDFGRTIENIEQL